MKNRFAGGVDAEPLDGVGDQPRPGDRIAPGAFLATLNEPPAGPATHRAVNVAAPVDEREDTARSEVSHSREATRNSASEVHFLTRGVNEAHDEKPHDERRRGFEVIELLRPQGQAETCAWLDTPTTARDGST